MLLQAGPHLQAQQHPLGCSWSLTSGCVSKGELTLSGLQLFLPHLPLLLSFTKTSLQGEERTDPMGKLKYELLLRMGSMGPFRVGVRVQG